MSYLKSHSSFLGLKQDRFTILLPSGLPDYSFEMVNNEQVKKVKVNRPKALCFDYLQLKEAFGLELETEIISDKQEVMEDNLTGQETVKCTDTGLSITARFTFIAFRNHEKN